MGAQGGVVDDPDPVGPGATEPIDAHLQFDEFPDVPMRLVVDTDVRVAPGAASATPAGSAEQFVEALTGRLATFPPDDVVLDADLTAQLDRRPQTPLTCRAHAAHLATREHDRPLIGLLLLNGAMRTRTGPTGSSRHGSSGPSRATPPTSDRTGGSPLGVQRGITAHDQQRSRDGGRHRDRGTRHDDGRLSATASAPAIAVHTMHSPVKTM